MYGLLLVTILAAQGVVGNATGSSEGYVYWDAARVEAAADRLEARLGDREMVYETIGNYQGHSIYLVLRGRAGSAQVHETESDLDIARRGRANVSKQHSDDGLRVYRTPAHPDPRASSSRHALLRCLFLQSPRFPKKTTAHPSITRQRRQLLVPQPNRALAQNTRPLTARSMSWLDSCPLIISPMAMQRTSPPSKMPKSLCSSAARLEISYPIFQEEDLGALTVGRYADFTVLSANPLKTRPDELRDLEVRMTVVGGQVVFRRR